MDINRVLIAGRLTRDPELKEIKPSIFTCKFSVATEYSYPKRDADGKTTYEKEVCFVEVTTWNKLAQRCGEVLKKGSSVTVDGRLKMEKWIDKTTATERTKLTVHTDNIFFLDARPADYPLSASQEKTRNFVNQELDKKKPEVLMEDWENNLPF